LKKTPPPGYANAFALIEAFVYLKNFPKGISAQAIKERFFSVKGERSFSRITKSIEDSLFDYQGDPVFFMENEGKKQIIRLHPRTV
jgi:hypothetical protein